MDIAILFLLVGVLAALGGVMFYIVRNFARIDTRIEAVQNDQTVSTLLGQVREQLERGQTESSAVAREQARQSQAIIQDVTKRLTELDATNRRVQDFANQLQSLENVLRNPKHRGVLGEYFLQNMLQEVLPPTGYQLQYKFGNGEIVDAAVFVGEKVVPVDAKFSLEHYTRMTSAEDPAQRDEFFRLFKNDLKGRIDETAKYVRPEENTTPFAFMYIPAEGIYASLLNEVVGSSQVNTRDLLKYAFEKRVMIVGPVSFFAYLQSALQGINAHQIAQSIQPILDRIRQLGVHIQSHDHHMQRLGAQLGTTVRTYNTAYKELAKIDKDVYKLTGKEAGGVVEPFKLEIPETVE